MQPGLPERIVPATVDRLVEHVRVVTAEALESLTTYGWPGNVRELQNVMAGLAVLAPARGVVAVGHVEQVLGETAVTMPPPASLDGARADWERGMLAAALARHDGRRTAAARELGLTRQGLAKALKRLNVDVESARSRRVTGAA